MRQFFAALFSNTLVVIPACGAPLYAGLQLGDTSVGGIAGFQANARYAVELHIAKSNATISHANTRVETDISRFGVAGVARFPMKLNEVLPYHLLAKAGWESTTTNETYTIPNSVALLDSGQVTNRKNQFIFGGAAEYEFQKKIVGRVGVEILGKDKSIHLAALYKF
jgi:hypothetical protein